MTKNYLSQKVFNNDLDFHKSGFLFIKQTNTIVIADIHLGKGMSLNSDGFQIPPYDVIHITRKEGDINIIIIIIQSPISYYLLLFITILVYY